jgi:hypothetical protein
MTLADELAEIAGKVGALRAQIDNINRRLVNHQGDEREQRRELGRLSGECLSLRLALLYKLEEHWPEVLASLRSATADTRQAKAGCDLIECIAKGKCFYPSACPGNATESRTEPVNGISEDAYYNLMDVLSDWEAKKLDEVDIRTIKRVLDQLNRARNVLARKADSCGGSNAT